MSEELTVYQPGEVPATMEDVARFLLIAPEKAAAMRAEIRAIQKVGLAKAVYDQKLEEQRRLCDMILDASVRLGEMTKAIPKTAGGDRRSEDFKKDNAVSFEKTKEETVKDLGFSPKQVQRFETLADNKDLVEQEKAQAREEGRMPTRTNVLNLAKERQKLLDKNKARTESDNRMIKLFQTAVYLPSDFPAPSEIVEALVRFSKEKPDELFFRLERLDQTIQQLQEIQILLRKEANRHGKV